MILSLSPRSIRKRVVEGDIETILSTFSGITISFPALSLVFVPSASVMDAAVSVAVSVDASVVTSCVVAWVVFSSDFPQPAKTDTTNKPVKIRELSLFFISVLSPFMFFPVKYDIIKI